MPGLGFQAQFAGLVESGGKTQTIRARRVHPIRKGDWLSFWVGLRTQSARKLGEGVCTLAQPIRIREGRLPRTGGPILPVIEVQGPRGGWRKLTRQEVVDLAIADGFVHVYRFTNFFRSNHGLPFTGHLIRWRLLPHEEWRKA